MCAEWGSTAALVELLLSDQEIISHADDGASEYDEDEEDEEQEEEDDEEDDYYDVEGQEEDEESPNIAALDIGSGSNADPTGSSMITIVELPHNSFRSFLGPIDRKVSSYYYIMLICICQRRGNCLRYRKKKSI